MFNNITTIINILLCLLLLSDFIIPFDILNFSFIIQISLTRFGAVIVRDLTGKRLF